MKKKDFVAGVDNTNVDLLFAGMPRLPAEGEEVFCEEFSLQLGGGAPATLINLSRLGINAKIGTKLGTDIFSEFAKAKYRENGVEPLNLNRGEGIPLNITCAAITKTDRTFVSYGQSAFEADTAMIDTLYNEFRGAKIALMHAGNFLPLYRRLKNDGTLLVFDTGWDDKMSLETYHEYIELADYITPNKKEALKLTGEGTIEKAALKLAAYFRKVVIKLDKDGCLMYEDGNFKIIKAVEDYKLKDSTGAGDAFRAGFVYGLFHNYPLDRCVLFGNITGGKCVTGIGCLTEYVNEEELLALAEKYDCLL